MVTTPHESGGHAHRGNDLLESKDARTLGRPHVSSFPQVLSLTVTNRCNLKCRMCGQWGLTGYMRQGRKLESMPAKRWIELVNEGARGGVKFVCLRGGETLLFPGIMDVIRAIKSHGIPICMDTNGTRVERLAEELAVSRIDIVNISVDGPEEIHDRVRGVPGTFKALAAGVKRLKEIVKCTGSPTTMSACFTISPDSLPGLARMGDVMRSLDIFQLSANPYYYFPETIGREYETIMKRELDCDAYSWRGFHREGSDVDPEEFIRINREFRANLGSVNLYPFMDFSEDEYRHWFSDSTTPVGRRECTNPFKLLDIQPGGDADFCVDFPDYIIGNVAGNSIEEVWNGERAGKFRALLKRGPSPICLRCGAKYMSS